MKQKYIVEIELPPNATITEAAKYIKRAVQVESGCLRPSDNMFHFNPNSVIVTPLYHEVNHANRQRKEESF